MGTLCSSGKTAAIEEEPQSETVVGLSKPSTGSDKKTFKPRRVSTFSEMQSLAIKFPKIKRSFKACQRVFDKYADGGKGVPKQSIGPMLVELGARAEDFNEDTIDKLFADANLDGQSTVNFKEFLIAAAQGVFLRVDIKNPTPAFKKIQEGFSAIQKAFKKIDADGSGGVDYEELKEAFLTASQGGDLAEARMKELDFNGDNDISLPEFIYGISSWVGLDEEVEEDMASAADLGLTLADSNTQKNEK